MPIDPDFWMQRRVLITGCTGFQGAWLSLWLQALGAELTGFARGAPGPLSLFALAGVGAGMREQAGDIRDANAVREAIAGADPEIVFHLAAQPTVNLALSDPVATYETNVMGTVNLLDAVRASGGRVRAVVVITSDACYAAAHGRSRPFVEGDPLGGGDPYSSSKAAAELVAGAYRRSYFARNDATRLATARVGNVIGGGDWGAGRLVADAMRAVQSGQPLHVRDPLAVRRWQHVLNPLGGYLQLAQRLCEDAGAARAWNFGAAAEAARPVAWIVERLGELWGGALRWRLGELLQSPDAARLPIDSSAAAHELGWRPMWGLDDGLAATVKWHRAHLRGADMRQVSRRQIEIGTIAGL